MSGYSTKKEADGRYSVVSSLGFTHSTGWSEADAGYQAQRLNKPSGGGNEQNNTPNQDNTNDTGGQGSTSNQLSGKKTELGIFGKIFTFVGCAVLLVVGIWIFGWAIATFVVK